MKPEEKAIVLSEVQGMYMCPNCNRRFQKKPRLNPNLKYYECPMCETVLQLRGDKN